MLVPASAYTWQEPSTAGDEPGVNLAVDVAWNRWPTSGTAARPSIPGSAGRDHHLRERLPLH